MGSAELNGHPSGGHDVSSCANRQQIAARPQSAGYFARVGRSWYVCECVSAGPIKLPLTIQANKAKHFDLMQNNPNANDSNNAKAKANDHVKSTHLRLPEFWASVDALGKPVYRPRWARKRKRADEQFGQTSRQLTD